MANESTNYQTQKSEDKKLVHFYDKILEKDNLEYDAQSKFLFQLICTKIAQLNHKTDQAKTLRNVMTIGIMLLSGTATIILGLKLAPEYWISKNSSNTALVLTSTTTFLSGLLSFWDIQTYWLRSKVMLNNLKELRYELAFALLSKSPTDTLELKQFLNRLVGIIGDEYWEKLMQKQGKEGHLATPNSSQMF